MELLERYLQAVGRYLTGATRGDVIAELRVNLLAEMDGRVEERGRPLTEGDVAEVLRRHGEPLLVAARYLPQRYLIGPALFPLYQLVLRKAAPFVVLIYLAARFSAMIFAEDAQPHLLSRLAAGMVQVIPTLLIFLAVVTIVFASLEYAKWQYHEGAGGGKEWDPRTLPPLTTRKRSSPSLAGKIVDLAIHGLWMIFVFSIPRHPFLVLGPGAEYLHRISISFAPVWGTFYNLLVTLVLLQLLQKLSWFIEGGERWAPVLRIGVKALAVIAMGVLAAAPVYFAASGPGVDLHTVATVNRAMHLGYRIATFAAALDLLVTGWKYLRKVVPTQQLAF